METEIIVAIITGLFGLIGIWLKARIGSNVPEGECSGRTDGTVLGQLPSTQAVKSAKLAATISLFFPGVGELYLGQSKKGLTIFIVAIILGGGTMGVVWFALGVYSCFHAHKIGCLLARGLSIRAWE